MATYEKTFLPGGIPKLIQVIEHLRSNNQDGYIQHQGSLIARFKGSAHKFGKLITCSPFTGSAIGVAFDPKFPRGVGETYEPLCNGDKLEPLPFSKFYAMHNDHDQPAQSLPAFGLGELIPMKTMRRGDQVGIDWFQAKGHSVFVWDVHLDEKGDVDCFQMIGAHGPAGASGYGIFIYGCHGPKYLKGSVAAGGPGTGSLEKAQDPLFVDSDDVVADGVWFGLPGVAKIDTRTFRVPPKNIHLAHQQKPKPSLGEIKVARFNVQHPPPKPYCMKEGGAEAYDPGPPGHLDAPVTTFKGDDLKKDPGAPAKAKPKPVTQDPKKPLQYQHAVEAALQDFYRAKWIDKDPGSSDNLNDAASQAAIKALQTKFKLDPDGIVGPKTWALIGEQLPACKQQQTSEVILGKLFRGGKLKCDPGKADGVNDDATKAAVLDFQKAKGLAPTGVPDAATFAKLLGAQEEHAVSSTQHGLEPSLLLVYWLGNGAAPGGSATLRVHSRDLKSGQALEVVLKDLATGKETDAGVKGSVSGEQTDIVVPVPASMVLGSWFFAKVKCALDGGKPLELLGPAPLQVRNEIKLAEGALETLFTYDGEIGEGSKARPHQYIANKIPGKSFAWFIKGRYMVDIDGAPNCYHPSRTDVLPLGKYATEMETWEGPLDKLANGGHPGNWFGVLTDTGEKDGTPVIQKDSDPRPGFCVSITSLVDRSKKRNDQSRYVNAVKIPYIAFPKQIWLDGQGGTLFKRVSQGPTGDLGDFVTVVNIKHPEHFGHAVIADVGDKPHFGEGSPALGKKLQFLQGTYEPQILYIVYPRSGAKQGTIPTPEEIEKKAGELFEKFGGAAEVQRVLGLMK